MSRSRPGAATLVAALITLLLAAPVAAQGPSEEHREAAEEALEHAQDLADGEGVRTGRELTPALAELAARRPALARSDREAAAELLARPSDTGDTGQPGGPYSESANLYRTCSANVCVHWIDATEDAPRLANADSCPATPDYVDLVRRSFEQSRQVENGALQWRYPVSDGARGGDGRTDVYLKELNADLTAPGRLFGYTAPDAGQAGEQQHAFLAVDDDFAADEFPEFAGHPAEPVRVTAAHEYNHLLQFAYAVTQDLWMGESTATWAEEQVFPGDDDFLRYMSAWANGPLLPLTRSTGNKMYGSAIWNHWLQRRYGGDIVRDAWEQLPGLDGFAPGAYRQAILDAGGISFGREFAEFAASTAEWGGADSGIYQGADFPGDVYRLAVTGAPIVLRPSGPNRVDFALDHTAFALVDVQVPTTAGTTLELSGTLAGGANGSVGLVARNASGNVTKVMSNLATNGDETVVRLPNANAYQRITGVLVNADIRKQPARVDGDWKFDYDDKAATLRLRTGTGTAGRVVTETAPPQPAGAAPLADCGTTTLERAAEAVPTPAPSPIPTPVPTAPPTPTPTPAPEPSLETSVRLSGVTSRLATVARRARLPFYATVNKPGRLTAKATVDRRTAKRLRLGRKRTVGTARRTISRAGVVKVNIKVRRAVRKAFKRQRRTVKVAVRARFVPGDGDRSVIRKLRLRVKP